MGRRWRTRRPRVAGIRERAARVRAALVAADPEVRPVVLGGRADLWIRSAQGQAWCSLVSETGLPPRQLSLGRSYLRHDCVVDLRCWPGRAIARVQGKGLYEVCLRFSVPETSADRPAQASPLAPWGLPGKHLSPGTWTGHCTCPSTAPACTHVAAALYALGARTDAAPETLRLLLAREPCGPAFSDAELERIFGLDLAPAAQAPEFPRAPLPVPAHLLRRDRRRR